MAATVLLHAAMLACLMPWPDSPQRREAERAVPVSLVLAPTRRPETPASSPPLAALARNAAPTAQPSSAGVAPAERLAAAQDSNLRRLIGYRNRHRGLVLHS
jgi:hypothetical protein